MPGISPRVLRFLGTDLENSGKGLAVIRKICLSSGVASTWSERAGCRHGMCDGSEGRERCIAVFPLALTSSPLRSVGRCESSI